MPRNGSGTYSVPNTFSTRTTISSTSVNSNFSDLGTEITNSVAKDGQTTMTGALKAAAGTAASPSLTFGSDTDTGLYRKTGDTIGIAAGGTEIAALDSTGLNVDGLISVDDGSASAPSITFGADTNTGLYRKGADKIGLTVGGSEVVEVSSTSVGGLGLPSGVMMPYAGISAPSGWVRANGLTIGNASSSATERANADTSALFTVLWNSYSDSVCAVSGGRGASAAVDYAANKTISLPDLRGRSLFGLDAMGNSAASRLGSVISGPTVNGSTGGSETVTLTVDQMPTHNHNASSSATSTASVSDPAHSHGLNNVLQSTGSTTFYGSGGSTTQASTTTNAAYTGISVSVSTSVSTTVDYIGGSSAHSNMPPAFLTTFIIKL